MKRIDKRSVQEQEYEDGRIIWRIMREPDPHSNAPKKRDIKIRGTRYSLHWILCYAQARNAGIACMHTSGEYANTRMRNFCCCFGGLENHYCFDYFTRDHDTAMLAKACEYMREHGMLKRPGGKLDLDLVTVQQ